MSLGTKTNNVEEFHTISKGFELVIKNNIKELHYFGDTFLIIEKMRKVKPKSMKLNLQTNNFLARSRNNKQDFDKAIVR